MTEITNGELMKVLLDIKGDVGEVKGGLHAHRAEFAEEKIHARTTEMIHNERIGKMEARTDERFGKGEGRIGKLENRQYWMSGVGTALGALAGIFGVHLKI